MHIRPYSHTHTHPVNGGFCNFWELASERVSAKASRRDRASAREGSQERVPAHTAKRQRQKRGWMEKGEASKDQGREEPDVEVVRRSELKKYIVYTRSLFYSSLSIVNTGTFHPA